ncbi:hypothetical protein ROT00_05335 [Agromyces mediolanus]|uniref:sensor histidine kinase n=1 Tax=Agromyces mediolanus TaxID=41986 RepID=UPI0038368AEF
MSPRARSGPPTASTPTVASSALEVRDRDDDRRVLLFTAGVLLTAFAIGSTLQTVFIYRPERIATAELIAESPQLPDRLMTNLVTVAIALLLAAFVRLEERRPLAAAGAVLAIALPVALARHGLQLLLGIYVAPELDVSLVEVGSVTVVIVVALGLALAQVRTRVRLREHERAEAEHRLRASTALAELAAEEMRVRREVADGLHGTLQGRLVLSQAAVDAIQRRGAEEGWSEAALEQLAGLRRDLERMREHDVRELSNLLYPVGVDVSLAHAVRALVRRVPAEIDITAEVAPEADVVLDRSGDGALAQRIAVVRGVEEGITNALRHGAATTIRVTVGVTGGDASPRVRATVEDDGVGLPDSPRWNGLARTSERLGMRGGSVELTPSELGGARLAVEVGAAVAR